MTFVHGKQYIKRVLARSVVAPYFRLLASSELQTGINRILQPKDGKDSILGQSASRVLREWSENGIAVSSLLELFPENKNLLAELQAFSSKALPSAKTRVGKPFLKAIWEETGELDSGNPFTALALSEQILTIIRGYLNLWPKYYYAALDETLPVGSVADPIRSQKWHRDPEDRKVCKIFLYLNDVDESAGPFVYVRKSHFGGKWGKLFPQKIPAGSYPVDDLRKFVPSSDTLTCTGQAGTLIFCDTAGLHRGGYALDKRRIMFTAAYLAPAAFIFGRNKFAAAGKTSLMQSVRLSWPAQYAVTSLPFGMRIFGSLSELFIRRGLLEKTSM